MNLKSLLARPFARLVYHRIRREMTTAVADQESILQMLLKHGQHTKFGKDHGLGEAKTYEDFKARVPVRDYEQLKPYFEQIKEGKENVLWKGKPIYLAKTSGTTSGTKYIPITRQSIGNHIDTARNALLCYMAVSGNYSFASGRMIFLSGSPELDRVAGIPTGRLSGIVNHHVPGYLRTNQLPSYTTNCIEDWETKLDAIVEETVNKDMTLISGIPPWMQMYFDRLTEKTGKKIGELFPNFSVMVQGGVNFSPYKARLEASIGRPIDTVELFPASEGFFAFQDDYRSPGLLLNTNSGIFYEFIPLAEVGKENPKRLSLGEIEVNENYALVVSSNAGLWAYSIGDTVKFISKTPYRLLVTGRIKHFISAFGEHVIAEEVESALREAMTKHPEVSVAEFTVAPMVSQDQGKSYHEWFIEFQQPPHHLAAFAEDLNTLMRRKNVYYEDLQAGNILLPLKITTVPAGGFVQYMKSVGRLGGQNKLPRLSNDRTIAEAVEKIIAG